MRLPIVSVFVAAMIEASLPACLHPLLPRILATTYCRQTRHFDLTTRDAGVSGYHTDSKTFTGSYQTSTTSASNSAAPDNVNSASAILAEDNYMNPQGNSSSCDWESISQYSGMIAGIAPLLEIITIPFIISAQRLLGNAYVYITGCLVHIAGVVVYILFPTIPGLVIGQVCEAVNTSVIMIAGFASLAEATREKETRVRDLSIPYVGFSTGSLFGFGAGSFLFQFGFWVPLLVVLAIQIVDLSLRLALVLRQHKDMVGKDKDPEKPTNAEELSYLVQKERSNVLPRCSTDVYVLTLALLTVVSTMVPRMVRITLPQHLLRRVDAWQMGSVFTAAAVIEVFVQVTVSLTVQSRLVRFTLLVISFGLHVLGALCCSLSFPVFWWYVVPLTFLETGEGLFGCFVTSLLSDLAERRGLDYNIVYATYASSESLGVGIGPIVAGFLYPIIGFSHVCHVIVCVTSLAAIVTSFTMWPFRRKR